MVYPATVAIVFHPDDTIGKDVAENFVAHFDRLGMRRAGVNMRVPVRFRSEALSPDGKLLPIEPEDDVLQTIVVLHSVELDNDSDSQRWVDLCADALASFPATNAPVFVIVEMESGLVPFPVMPRAQRALWFRWGTLTQEQRIRRLMLHTINAMRRRLAGLGAGTREPVFVSHAKSDGRLAAERVVAHIGDPANDVRLDAFYDALDLDTGEDFAVGLKQAVTSGALLSLVSDSYDDRPWCNQELLWAKQAKRPIVMVDIGRQRADRSFPYAGNVPVLRDALDSDTGIERVLLELLSEALRCDLFLKSVEGVPDLIALPRPPELVDLAFIANNAPAQHEIVYPGPSISDAETALLEALSGGRKIRALGDI